MSVIEISLTKPLGCRFHVLVMLIREVAIMILYLFPHVLSIMNLQRHLHVFIYVSGVFQHGAL